MVLSGLFEKSLLFVVVNLFELLPTPAWFVSCSAGLVVFYPFSYRECALVQTLSQRLRKQGRRYGS